MTGIWAFRSVLRATQSDPGDDPVGPTSLGAALARLSPIVRQQGLVVVVGDLRGVDDWRQPMTSLACKHQVVAIEVSDPRELDIPNVGELILVDPETGRQLRVDTSSEKVRKGFASAATAERTAVAKELRSIGVRHLVLSTSGDWLRALVDFFRRERRAW